MRPDAIRKANVPKPAAPERRLPIADDDVERDSNDSFPASDPPSWIPVARVGRPRISPPAAAKIHGG